MSELKPSAKTVKENIGKTVTVNKPESMSHGLEAIVILFKDDNGKYEVKFKGCASGWFKPEELIGLDQPHSASALNILEADIPEVSMLSIIQHKYAEGNGLLSLSYTMTEEARLEALNVACKLANGKPFTVICLMPKMDTA